MTFNKPVLQKKKRKFIPMILLISVVMVVISVNAENTRNIRIVTTPAVSVRDTPGVDGKVLARKYRGDMLIVFSRSEKPVRVNGIRGYWVEVDDGYISKSEMSNGKRGWVFSGFLGDYRKGPAQLYQRAMALEKTNTSHALHTYRRIIKEYPRAREIISEDCYGIYSEYADNRIKIISCDKNSRNIPEYSFDELKKELIKNIQNNNYDFFDRITTCQVSFDNGRLLWGISPMNINRYIRLSDIDTSRISSNPSSIFFYSKTKPVKYYFLFKKNSGRYRLTALGKDR